jgi:pimeloyl-ACP methyl ester carboxylesterase
VSEPLPIVLIPGLLASARMYAGQIPQLWRAGPVMIADHTRDDSMAGIARRILSVAPARFALAGLSMGGYIAFEMLRQAPERIVKVALLDTSARADAPEQTAMRRAQMTLASQGRLTEVVEQQFPRLVDRAHRADAALRRVFDLMAEEVGAAGFIRQQTAIFGRADSRATLGNIRCPTLVLVGEGDELTPPERAEEIASGIPGARLTRIPHCGHVSTLEQPDEVARALLEWLEA